MESTRGYALVSNGVVPEGFHLRRGLTNDSRRLHLSRSDGSLLCGRMAVTIKTNVPGDYEPFCGSCLNHLSRTDGGLEMIEDDWRMKGGE